MELNQLRVSEFAQVTASDAPAPGGGSVSALAGALAAALAEMVAHLTAGGRSTPLPRRRWRPFWRSSPLAPEAAVRRGPGQPGL